MPSRRNPLQMSRFLGHLRQSVDEAKDRAHEFAEEHGIETKYVDVAFQFIGASGIPKMDVVGTADPYFIAKLDGIIKYVYVCAALAECSLHINNVSAQINSASGHAEPGVE